MPRQLSVSNFARVGNMQAVYVMTGEECTLPSLHLDSRTDWDALKFSGFELQVLQAMLRLPSVHAVNFDKSELASDGTDMIGFILPLNVDPRSWWDHNGQAVTYDLTALLDWWDADVAEPEDPSRMTVGVSMVSGYGHNPEVVPPGRRRWWPFRAPGIR